MIDLMLKIDLNPLESLSVVVIVSHEYLPTGGKIAGRACFGSGGFGLGRAGFGLWAGGPAKDAALGTMRSGGVVLFGTLVQGP